MAIDKKWSVLFIKDDTSLLHAETELFERLFSKVDKVGEKEEALKLYEVNTYDIIICDITVDPLRVALLKQLKDIRDSRAIFALSDPKDTGKLYGIADLGINAFELDETQFDQALEMIANIDPYNMGE